MPTQSNYRYTLDAGEKHHFDVVSFKLSEGLSEPFRLELMLSSIDPNVSQHNNIVIQVLLMMYICLK
ncbi:hypothetical protein [Aggregatibacter actinomycetemcomitans]|uniref:Uncharacterized protein n=1 Tax=Aggregatibacter actinomycetemcomitans TaxID=714 RepID=A0A2G1DT64_AGGAC|nr:hypothetical protein [Aggregatibacter actinomycetemcomitans]PHO21671.1 hypothetical protein CQR80_00840 [Aggregatibacter actinomycetemcomitans]